MSWNAFFWLPTLTACSTILYNVLQTLQDGRCTSTVKSFIKHTAVRVRQMQQNVVKMLLINLILWRYKTEGTLRDNTSALQEIINLLIYGTYEHEQELSSSWHGPPWPQ